MSTAVKKKKSGKPAPRAKAGPKPKSHGLTVLESKMVDVACIDPNPFQPRGEFPEAEIEALGKAMQEQGQLTPLTLREADGRYQSLDGGRRVLAARKAGIAELRAEICAASDAQARAITLATVLHRTDLSAIEQARAFQNAIEHGDAAGPTELAESLGIDQSTVSNRLRLLELPEIWQDLVISREISERHARAVLRWLDYPGVMDDLERAVEASRSGEEGEICPVYQWENEIIPAAVRNHSRSLSGVHGDRTYYDSKLGKLTIFEPGALDIKRMDIITLDEEERAMNCELFDQLQAEHVEEILAERAREAEAESERRRSGEGEKGRGGEREDAAAIDEGGDEDRSDDSGDGVLPDGAVEAKKIKLVNTLGARGVAAGIGFAGDIITAYVDEDGDLFVIVPATKHDCELRIDLEPADWEEIDTAPSAKTHDNAGDGEVSPSPLFPPPSSSPLRNWLLGWAQWLIADEIRVNCNTNTVLGMLLLGLHSWKLDLSENELDKICGEILPPERKKTLTERLLNADIYHVERIVGQIVAGWFFSEDDGPMFRIDGEEIKRIVDILAIDLEGEFSAGNVPTAAALLNAVDEATLTKWAATWKIEVPAKTKRPKLIELLEAAVKDGRPMPSELKAAWKQIGRKA